MSAPTRRLLLGNARGTPAQRLQGAAGGGVGSASAKPGRYRLVFSGRCVTGTFNCTPTPLPFPLPSSVYLQSIACGKLHIAVTDVNGNVYTCGVGDGGQLGLGPDVLSTTALTPVPSLSGVTKIACGSVSTGALTASGQLYMTGFVFPELEFEPRLITFTRAIKVLDFALGKSHALVITAEPYSVLPPPTPAIVTPRSTIVSPPSSPPSGLALGSSRLTFESICSSDASLSSSGGGGGEFRVRVQTWGRSLCGALGLNQESVAKTPTYLELFDDYTAKSVFAGSEQSALVTAKGQLFVWGVVSEVDSLSVPVMMPLHDVSCVAFGEASRLIVAGGKLYAAGNGETGTLGCGEFVSLQEPERVPVPVPIPDASGPFHACSQLAMNRNLAVLVYPSLLTAPPPTAGADGDDKKRRRERRLSSAGPTFSALKRSNTLLRTAESAASSLISSLNSPDSASSSSSSSSSGSTSPPPEPLEETGIVYLWGKAIDGDLLGTEMAPLDCSLPIRWPNVENVRSVAITSQAIYMIQDMPYFGIELEELMKFEDGQLPWLVDACINALESKDRLQSEGVFRLNGNNSKIASIADLCNKGVVVDDIGSLHVDTIAGLLKRFLRALPTPLITADVQQALSTCLDLPNRLAVADAIYSCLQQLPKHRRLLLERLLHLLHKTLALREHNQMSLDALTICWLPVMMGDAVMTRTAMHRKHSFELLIEYGDVWFENYQAVLNRVLENYLNSEPALQPNSLALMLQFLDAKLGHDSARRSVSLHHEKLVSCLKSIGPVVPDEQATWDAYRFVLSLCLPSDKDTDAIVVQLRLLWKPDDQLLQQVLVSTLLLATRQSAYTITPFLDALNLVPPARSTV